ncbi:hypothetical protein D3C77_242840 [compost metagenome]
MIAGQEGAARQVQVVPIAVTRQAVGLVGRVQAVMGIANGDRGAVAEVSFQHAMEQLTIGVELVDIGVAVLVDDDATTTQLAIEPQRPADIQFGTVVVPTADRLGYQELVERGGTLAHQVDAATRLAVTRVQAISATQDFDVVIDGHVEVFPGEGTDPHRCATVKTEVGDFKTPRQVAGVGHAALVGGHPGGLGEHVVHGGQVLVFDALAGDDTDALRGVFDRLWHLADRYRTCGVRAATFGGHTQ